MDYICESCRKSFSLSEKIRQQYPNWTPKKCQACGRGGKRAEEREENLTLAEVLAKYQGGPSDGVFTDGSAFPNPGRGGWGAVYVVDGKIAAEADGSAKATTNNRMELSAIIAGCGLVPPGRPAVIYTDSTLCANTINLWAERWESRGWTRGKKGGELKNLDLVKELFGIFRQRPELKLKWIKSHSGNRWNEYADSLSTAWRRDVR